MDTPSDVVAARIKVVRRKRLMTVAQLAARCAELGAVGLTEQALYNVETGRPDKQGRRRRAVSVDELLALAHALDVAPIHLLVPTDEGDYQVTPTTIVDRKTAREWVRGLIGLPGTNLGDLYSEGPLAELLGGPVEKVLRRRDDGTAAYEWVFQPPKAEEA